MSLIGTRFCLPRTPAGTPRVSAAPQIAYRKGCGGHERRRRAVGGVEPLRFNKLFVVKDLSDTHSGIPMTAIENNCLSSAIQNPGFNPIKRAFGTGVTAEVPRGDAGPENTHRNGRTSVCKEHAKDGTLQNLGFAWHRKKISTGRFCSRYCARRSSGSSSRRRLRRMILCSALSKARSCGRLRAVS
jgi:hypothetical protein